MESDNSDKSNYGVLLVASVVLIQLIVLFCLCYSRRKKMLEAISTSDSNAVTVEQEISDTPVVTDTNLVPVYYSVPHTPINTNELPLTNNTGLVPIYYDMSNRH